MKLKLANNAESLLTGTIGTSDTTILLTPTSGNLFPAIASGEFFPLTLVKTSGGTPAREIVYVTARSGDSCTVLRAQEGTTALAFSSGDYAGCHLTAGCVAGKADLVGANFVGPVNMGNCRLTQAVTTDCAQAFNNNGTINTIDISAAPVQAWTPTPGAKTLTITGWPQLGHGELLIYGSNLGACNPITISGSAVYFVNSDGTFTHSNNLSTNHGATLQTSGLDFILLWSPDGGVTRFAKVIR